MDLRCIVLVLALVLGTCAPPINIFNGAPCTSTLTFGEALAAARVQVKWGATSDSPNWMADARWPAEGGYLASNVNDCAAPLPR